MLRVFSSALRQNRRRALVCLALVLGFGLIQTVNAQIKPCKVFICAGQSNMAGSGGIGSVPEPLKSQADIWADYATPSDPGNDTPDWVPLGSWTGTFGPELLFARTIADAFPDYQIAIIKVSQPATIIEYFLTGDGGTRLMERINVCIARSMPKLSPLKSPATSLPVLPGCRARVTPTAQPFTGLIIRLTWTSS